MTVSETGERQLQAKDCQVFLTTLSNREEARRHSPLQDSEGAQPSLPTPRFWTSSHWNLETMHFWGFEPGFWGIFVNSHPGNEYSHEVEMCLVGWRNMEVSVAGAGVIGGQRGYITDGEMIPLYGSAKSCDLPQVHIHCIYGGKEMYRRTWIILRRRNNPKESWKVPKLYKYEHLWLNLSFVLYVYFHL